MCFHLSVVAVISSMPFLSLAFHKSLEYNFKRDIKVQYAVLHFSQKYIMQIAILNGASKKFDMKYKPSYMFLSLVLIFFEWQSDICRDSP